jgi:hypothetical protein
VRFNVDEVGDSVYRVLEALGRFELALAVVLVAGGVGAGVAILLELAILPAVVVGASLAAIGLVVLGIRARRQGTTVFGDD